LPPFLRRHTQVSPIKSEGTLPCSTPLSSQRQKEGDYGKKGGRMGGRK